MVPISHDRIIINNNYQKDSTTSNQILIPMKILQSNNNSIINVSAILKTLNIMIKNKEITSTSNNNFIIILDGSYGLIEFSK